MPEVPGRMSDTSTQPAAPRPAAASAPAAPADPDLSGRTVWAVDTLSRVYQLFHALPEMSAPDGTPVSAVFGLTRDLLDITARRRPDYLFFAMDAPGPTFRHEKFAAYKANRAEMPADLVPQIPLVRRLVAACGVPLLERPGFEADDLLATLATRTTAAGGACVIATSDKDARQLIGDRVHLLNPRDVVPESNMPRFPWLADATIDGALVAKKMEALRKVGVPYTDADIAGAGELVQGKTELDALIVYLQGLGTNMKAGN